MEISKCQNYSAGPGESWGYLSLRLVARDSGNRLPRRRRFLVVSDFRARALVGESDEKKEVLHASALLLSAKSAVQFAQRKAAINLQRVPQPPSDTWLD
jgi:hypothetical protein